MKRIAELYGFEDVEQFAKYLIDKAREERLIVTAEISSSGFSMSIEPLENRVYICPHYGETRESR